MRYALIVCVFAGCYQPSRLNCAVSCASGTLCPGGMTCGADELCHSGSLECSNIDASVDFVVDAEAPVDPASDAGRGAPSDARVVPPSDARVVPPVDARPPPPVDARPPPPVDARPSPPAFCDPTQPFLVACYEFEGNGNDGSNNHLNAAHALSFKPGKVGFALEVGATSTVQIAESTVLDLQRFTVEAWVNQSSATQMNVGILTNVGQYGMFLDPSNEPFCAYAAPPGGLANLRVARAGTPLTTNRWTHLACTYDGAKLTVYVDGAAAAVQAQGGPVFTGGTTGTALGGDGSDPSPGIHYLGLIDQLRMFSAARTAAAICTDSGRSSCSP